MVNNSEFNSEFSELPMCIHKDSYLSDIRTYLISINNNVVRPNRKLIINTIERQLDFKKVFSPYHFHEGIEILRISKGSCTVVINDKSYKATENDILVVNPFEAHGIYLDDTKTKFERTCLIFKPSDLFPAKKQSNLPLYNMLSGTCFQNFVSGNEMYSPELCRCIDVITDIANTQSVGWQVAILGQLVTFYSVMIREGLQQQDSSFFPYRLEFMSSVTDFVETHLAEEITTKRIAEHCLYTTEHFCRLFRKCFNRTFKEYLNICRVQRARDIFDSGRCTGIGEVGLLVGFKNANHFCNTFKKSVGMPPSEYISRKEK